MGALLWGHEGVLGRRQLQWITGIHIREYVPCARTPLGHLPSRFMLPPLSREKGCPRGVGFGMSPGGRGWREGVGGVSAVWPGGGGVVLPWWSLNPFKESRTRTKHINKHN